MSSTYNGLTLDEMEELLSNFAINSWSYSRVSTFVRNEKAFEMQYIYGLYPKSSATTEAGSAYHRALEYYFRERQQGRTLDLIDLEKVAFEYLDDIKPNTWKLQKTTPTVESCIHKATATVTQLLRNFYTEKGVYEDDIEEILDVETGGEEFVTVNGVDIPLPCRFKIDLVVKTKRGTTAIVDHKSKSTFTDDEEAAFVIGTQAVTYVVTYEALSGITADEVWFVENKYSQNKNGAAQLVKIPVEINANTRKLYEALLYEPLKRMVEAVSNPDYVYVINDADNYVSRAEIYDFWVRTMICEVEDFNVDEAKKHLVAKRLKKVRDAAGEVISPTVIKRFKENADKFIQYDLSNKNMTPEEKIEHVLRSFNVIAKVAQTFEGYSSNTYLLDISAGVKVSSIFNYRLDLANQLNVPNVRISQQMKVHDGRAYLSIEVEKPKTRVLEYCSSDLVEFKIPIGKDNFNNTVVWDMDNHSTPHMLVCGGTGSGKSVFLNSTISYALEAGVEEVHIMDPKFEFVQLNGQGNVFVYNDILEIEERMKLLVEEMDRLASERKSKRILVVFDEFADAVEKSRKGPELDIKEMVEVGRYAPKKGPFGMVIPGEPKMKLQKVGTLKSLEENMRILLQKGRSLGFRIICAMQRASTKVITGDAKVNMPVQICFRVNKQVDSKVVLDEIGAEDLTGKGDGLLRSPEYPDTIRFQAYYKPETVMV